MLSRRRVRLAHFAISLVSVFNQLRLLNPFPSQPLRILSRYSFVKAFENFFDDFASNLSSRCTPFPGEPQTILTALPLVKAISMTFSLRTAVTSRLVANHQKGTKHNTSRSATQDQGTCPSSHPEHHTQNSAFRTEH